MTARKVSARARRFVEEYLVDHNGSAAIVRAGFTGTRPDVAASKLLARPEVVELLDRRLDQKLRGAGYRFDSVVLSTIEIRERCMQARPVLDRQGNQVMVETPTGERVPAYGFDAANAMRANEFLAKLLGVVKHRHELTGKDGAPLPVAAAAVTKDEFREIARELLNEV